MTRLIVRSICQRVETACREVGVPLRGGVAYGVSPTFELIAEQHPVPTTATSVIELSSGFINFCSHLSKAMSLSLLHENTGDSVRIDSAPSEVLKRIGSDPELRRLWLELFGAYAYGDGPLNVEWRIVPYPQSLTRAMLLSGFEQFAIAHEYAHHVEEHGRVESIGVGGDPDSPAQEIEADMFATALCRYMERHEKQPNIFLVSGAAPVLLLKCLDYVRRTRKIFSGGEVDPDESSGTHPETNERILAFNSYVDGLSSQEASAFQRLRQEFCFIADAVWIKLRLLYISMYENGLRREDNPISWLPD